MKVTQPGIPTGQEDLKKPATNRIGQELFTRDLLGCNPNLCSKGGIHTTHPISQTAVGCGKLAGVFNMRETKTEKERGKQMTVAD